MTLDDIDTCYKNYHLIAHHYQPWLVMRLQGLFLSLPYFYVQLTPISTLSCPTTVLAMADIKHSATCHLEKSVCVCVAGRQRDVGVLECTLPRALFVSNFTWLRLLVTLLWFNYLPAIATPRYIGVFSCRAGFCSMLGLIWSGCQALIWAFVYWSAVSWNASHVL